VNVFIIAAFPLLLLACKSGQMAATNISGDYCAPAAGYNYDPHIIRWLEFDLGKQVDKSDE
jgi:hypothetical protein